MSNILRTRWNKREQWESLQQILKLPIMEEALAIIEAESIPQTDKDLLLIGTMPAAEAAFHINRVHFTQSGVATALQMLRGLAKPPPKPPEASKEAHEPFSHITEENAESYLEPK